MTSFGDACVAAPAGVGTAERLVGPWVGDAPQSAARAYRNAESRRPIAVAIGERFHHELHAPLDGPRQQWWTTPYSADAPREPVELFRDFGDVYGNGEFTGAGFWTVTDPPADVHDDLIGVWEMFEGPISRWRLPTNRSARVYELHRPEDWLSLVRAHPTEATRPHGGWELPGRDEPIGLSELMSVKHQNAAVTELRAHLLPDWASVSESFDAVHLSWAGFITMEGCVSGTGDGAVTMLRYWRSERTLWLADCFGEPEPLGRPILSGHVGGVRGVSSAANMARRTNDREYLRRLLGR